jgi:sigma54-dependent transcription regulator
METPDIDAVLKRLLTEPSRISLLAPEDEAYLTSLITAVRAGRKAVLIVEDEDERLRYMFSNATRAEAVSVLGKVVEAAGRCMMED